MNIFKGEPQLPGFALEILISRTKYKKQLPECI